MPVRALIVLLASCLLAFSAHAQRTTRKPLKVEQTVKTRTAASQEPYDTLLVSSADTIMPVAISGFEKTLRSRNESLFVTNRLETELVGIEIEISYFDMQSRLLHKRIIALPCSIPPGETRQLNFPTWDKQQVWYYHLSDTPRTRAQATPFRVAATATKLITRQ